MTWFILSLCNGSDNPSEFVNAWPRLRYWITNSLIANHVAPVVVGSFPEWFLGGMQGGCGREREVWPLICRS